MYRKLKASWDAYSSNTAASELTSDSEKNSKWLPAVLVAGIIRASEAVGMQFVSVWLEKTATPFWLQLEEPAGSFGDGESLVGRGRFSYGLMKKCVFLCV